jgi:hypothetical protein
LQLELAYIPLFFGQGASAYQAARHHLES